MGTEIRRVTIDDVEALRSTRLAALADSPSAFGSRFRDESVRPEREWSTRARLASSGADRATFLAWFDDAPVGIVGGYCELDGDVHLISMWVDPIARGAGLGRRLVDTVIAWAVEHDAPAVTLWVTEGNEAAVRLYESAGFSATGERQPLPSDPGRDELQMRRQLSGRSR